MADCSGCPHLRQEAGQSLCAMRNNEAIDGAPYTKETCEHYQAYLKAFGEEDSDKKKEKKRGGGGTGCLVALLVASILMFLFVLGLIAIAVFFGGKLPI